MGLDSLVCALNNRVSSVQDAGSVSQRFYGRKIRLGLPGLGIPLSAEKRNRMQAAMKQHRMRYGKALKTHNSIQYKLGQPVLVFLPKQGQFSETGVIEAWTPADDLLGPRNFSVRMSSGSLRRVNSSWLSPLPGQHQKNSQDTDQ